MKKMNRILVGTRFFLALTTSVVAMAATEANGAWSDNFDSYVDGSTIIGQGAWAGWELAGSGVNDTTVTDDQASSGAHSLMMGGAPYVDVIPQFAGVTSGIWLVEAMSYVPGSSNTGITDIGFLSRHLGFQGAADTQWFGPFRLDMANDFAGGLTDGLPIIRDEWVPMQTIFDIDERTFLTFYNGELANEGSWPGDNALVGLDVWSSDNASTMYYDDFNVASAASPELPGDFDGDGNYDHADVDPLVADIAAGANTPSFDLTADGLVDTADLTSWLAEAGEVNLGLGLSYLLGDADLSGDVGAADLNQVGINWQQQVAAWSAGDFTANGTVDAADLNQLGINWQMSSLPAALEAAVPEPSGLMVLAAGAAGLGLWRKRRTGKAA